MLSNHELSIKFLVIGLMLLAFAFFCTQKHINREKMERYRLVVAAALKEHEQRIQQIIDNYTARAMINQPHDNASRINTLIASGIAALSRNGEMVEVLNGLEKYGVGWPNTWGFTPKTLFDKLASTGTVLETEASVGNFIMQHLHQWSTLPPTTPEELAELRKWRSS